MFSKSKGGRLKKEEIFVKNAPTMVGGCRKFSILEPLKWLFQCFENQANLMRKGEETEILTGKY